MAKDLTLTVQDQPGAVAAVLEALGNAGINVEGACGVPVDGKGIVHVLVEDGDSAKQALQQAGLQVTKEQDAIVTAVEDTPGAGGRMLRMIADAGVNLTAVYLATNTRVAICADNIDKAREQLQAGVGAPQAHT